MDLVTDHEPMAEAEIFDPQTGHFTATGSMIVPRSYFKAVLLNNENVLVAGGFSSGKKILQSTEICDPAIGKFHLAGSTARQRYKLSAVAPPDGHALIVDGSDEYPAGKRPETELRDATAKFFRPIQSYALNGFLLSTATLLKIGKILIVERLLADSCLPTLHMFFSR